MTGNGKFIPPTYDAPSGSYINGNYGDSFVGLAPDTVHNSSSNQNSNGWGLKVITYFTPANQAILSGSDLDLGSGGPMLLPDSVGSPAHPHLIVGAGKQGTIYMVDRDNMGGGNYSSTSDMVVQEDLGAVVSCYTVPAYFNGAFYMMSTGRKTSAMPSTANAFTISSGSFSTTAVSTPDTFGYTGSSPCISGTSATDPNAIVWCLDCGPSASNQLRAYCASNFSQEIYHRREFPRLCIGHQHGVCLRPPGGAVAGQRSRNRFERLRSSRIEPIGLNRRERGLNFQ
jgi:hypothetical protein